MVPTQHYGLSMPHGYEILRVLGVDPGLNFTGVSLVNYDTRLDKIVSAQALTLRTDHLSERSFVTDDFAEERWVKIAKLSHAFTQLLNTYCPHHVASEAPFYNALRPVAYGALTEVLSSLKMAVTQWNPYVSFETIPPGTVKKLVGAKAAANDTVKGKELVAQALSKIPALAVLQPPLIELTEHAIDAVAVAYSSLHLQGYLK